MNIACIQFENIETSLKIIFNMLVRGCVEFL